MKFAVVKKPDFKVIRRDPGFWRDLAKLIESLPDDEAVKIPASEVKSAQSFRSCVSMAAARLGIAVTIRKGDGVYLVSKRERVDVLA